MHSFALIWPVITAMMMVVIWHVIVRPTQAWSSVNYSCYAPFGCYAARTVKESIYTSSPLMPLPPKSMRMRLVLLSGSIEPRLQLPAELLIAGNWTRSIDNQTPHRIHRDQSDSFRFSYDVRRLADHLRSQAGHTYFIVHGFRYTHRPDDYFDKIRKTLETDRDSESKANIVLIDWSTASESASYMQIVASVPLMGSMVSQLIVSLHKNYFFNVNNLQLVGHSVGAHVAGLAARQLKSAGIDVKRVLALDPAGPFFRSESVEGRLDRSDAVFVECLYSASASNLLNGFGSDLALGHLNLYINGGRNQPGCEVFKRMRPLQLTANFKLFKNLFNCDHHRGIELLSDETREECQLIAYKCSTYTEYLAGECVDCGVHNQSCHLLSFHSLPVTFKQGNFYLLTGSQSPFCVYTYRLVIHHHGFQYGVGQYAIRFQMPNHYSINTSDSSSDNESSLQFTFSPSSRNVTTRLIDSSLPLHNAQTAMIAHQDAIRSQLWFWLQVLPNRRLHVHRVELQYISHSDSTIRIKNTRHFCRHGNFSLLKHCS